MKKITAVFLSALMILASFCAVIPASAAPSGTAIKDAAGFAAMAENGTYYLDADITLAATYNNTFTGTLDGNGHTVTVSAPMFKQLNGTVKNLTIVGEVKVELDNKAHIGALAQQAKGPTVDNVTNKANVTVTQTGGDEGRVGGLIGRLNGHGDAPHAAIITNCTNDGDVTGLGAVGGIVGCSYDGGSLFENCVNNGKINNPAGIKDCFAGGGIYGYNGSGAVTVKNCVNNGEIVSAFHAGGIAGDARKSVVVEKCTNNGNVRLSSAASRFPDGNNVKMDAAAGGIVGFALDGACTVALTLTKCINTGSITGYIAGSASGRAAGIVGYTQKSAKVPVVVTNCINNGTIKAGSQAGGLIGYVYGSDSTFATIDGCINNGDVYSAQWASEYLAYSNHGSTVIKNSIGAGKLLALNEGKTNYFAIVGLSSSDIAKYTIENLFLADNGTTKLLSWATSTSNVKNRIALAEVLGKDLAGTTITDYEGNNRGLIEASNVKAITRGELNADLIAKANTAIGSELFELANGKVKFKTLSVGAGNIAPSDLSVDHAAVSVVEGQSVTVKSFFDPLWTASAVRWESDDETVATVSNGVITGVKPGQTTVKVSCGSLSDTCTVTVTERVPVTGVNLDKTQLTVKVGFVATLTATVIPENTTDDTTVVWSSDNESVATVVGGVVTGVAEGTAKITAKCGDHTATCDVTVESASCQHKTTVTVGYHAPNHVKQWAGESGVTTCLDCGDLVSENVKLAPGAHKGGKTYAYDADAHWKTCTYKGCTAEVKNTRGAHTYNDAGVCSVCGYGAAGTLRGDLNADGRVDSEDALYLLKNTFFGSQYPISQSADFTADGKVDSDDAIYLLKHTFFGEQYPLN